MAAISPYFLTPELDQKKESAQHKIALQLLQQGTSGEPVTAWTQGLARMAQGALGGYELYKEDAADKAREKAIAGAIDSFPGMTPPGQIAPIAAQLGGGAPPSAPPAPPVQPRGPAPGSPATRVASAFDGIQGAVDAGKLDPRGAANNMGAPPTAALPPPAAPAPPPAAAGGIPQVAAALSAPGGPTPTIQPHVIPADVQEKIRKLWGVAATRPEAEKIRELYGKPKEQFDPIITPEDRARAGIDPTDKAGYQRERATGKIATTNTSPNISMNTVANPFMEAVAGQLGKARDSATTAVNTLPILHEARRSLDLGATTGAAADWRVKLQKVGALFGLDASKAENSEVFMGAVGREVLAHAKDLGPNPSNADRDYIKAVEGGDIRLEEGSIRRLLDISERAQRRKIQFFNSQSGELMKGAPDKFKGMEGLMRFEEPPEYKPPTAPATAPSRAAPGKIKIDVNGNVIP